MHIFLTSLPYGEYRTYTTDYRGLNPANGFLDAVRSVWKDNSRVLFIASEPDNYEMVDLLFKELRVRLKGSEFQVASASACDHRNVKAADDLNAYDAIFLSGGHVPTTNDFYKEIGLREKMKAYDGIVVGISSGSMNSAETVYAQPEFEGETKPSFVKFRQGLGLVNMSIIPHYQVIKDDIVDGKRLFEEVSYPDSVGRRFYVFVDGTYAAKHVDKSGTVPKRIGDTVIYGKAYILEDGVLKAISELGETAVVTEDF